MARGLEDLYAYAKTPAGTASYVAAGSLYAQALALSILLQGFSSSAAESPKYDPSKPSRPNFHLLQRTPTTFDHPSFQAAQEILSIGKKLVAHPKFVKGFVFDAGIIPSLWIIVMLCPDRELKTEATQILRNMDGRVECVWNSAVVAQTGEQALALVDEMGYPDWRCSIETSHESLIICSVQVTEVIKEQFSRNLIVTDTSVLGRQVPSKQRSHP